MRARIALKACLAIAALGGIATVLSTSPATNEAVTPVVVVPPADAGHDAAGPHRLVDPATLIAVPVDDETRMLPPGIRPPAVDGPGWEPVDVPEAALADLLPRPTYARTDASTWPETAATCWVPIVGAEWRRTDRGETFLVIADHARSRVVLWRVLPGGALTLAYASGLPSWEEEWPSAPSSTSRIDRSCDGSEIRVYAARRVPALYGCDAARRTWLTWASGALAIHEIEEGLWTCFY